MKQPFFTGACTALVTPFLGGKVNYPMMEQLLRRQIDAGIEAVVICGTTGESATLSDCEKLENGVSFAAADRYLALIYPEFACAADYISQDAAVFFCDHGNLQRGAQANSG